MSGCSRSVTISHTIIGKKSANPFGQRFHAVHATQSTEATILKQFSRVQVYIQRDRSIKQTLGFQSDIDGGLELRTKSIESGSFGFGLGEWSNDPWGDPGLFLPAMVIRTVVPRPAQKCRGLKVSYNHKMGKASFLINQLAIQARKSSERTERGPR